MTAGRIAGGRTSREPPDGPVCETGPAGAAPRSAQRTPPEGDPRTSGDGSECKSGFRGGDNFCFVGWKQRPAKAGLVAPCPRRREPRGHASLCPPYDRGIAPPIPGAFPSRVRSLAGPRTGSAGTAEAFRRSAAEAKPGSRFRGEEPNGLARSIRVNSLRTAVGSTRDGPDDVCYCQTPPELRIAARNSRA